MHTPPFSWRALGALALLLGGAPARAQEASELKFSAGYTVQTDSNLFRLPAGADAPALLGQPSATERIGVASVGVHLNTTLSLQQLELDASLVDYRYQNFSYLSFAGVNYDAAWRWAVTPRWTGKLSSERKQSLNSFADYQGFTQRNQRTDTHTRLDTVYEVAGPWRLVGGLERTSQANQQALVAGGDYASTAADAGVRLLFGSGSTLTYSARAYNGSYLNRVLSPTGLYDDAFHQTDHTLRLHWVLSGKTSANAHLTRLSRSHPNFAQRDYAGFNAGASFNWAISGKSALSGGYARELSSYETGYASYAQSDRITIAPVWQISAKTLLSLRHVWAQTDYLGAPGLLSNPSRRDTTRDTTLSFTWQPYPQLSLSAALQSAARGSTLAALDYDSTQVFLSAQYSY